jgi:hypothetical protein
MNANAIDSALAEVYEAFDVPLDRFFGDEVQVAELMERVHKRLPNCQFTANELMARLLSLRKQGKLPRLRRAYFGRGATVTP